MKITAKQAKELTWGDSEEFETIIEGDWVSDGKYEICESIFCKDGKFFKLNTGRSGSHFTDWEYDWDYEEFFECPEVKGVDTVVTVWKEI